MEEETVELSIGTFVYKFVFVGNKDLLRIGVIVGLYYQIISENNKQPLRKAAECGLQEENEKHILTVSIGYSYFAQFVFFAVLRVYQTFFHGSRLMRCIGWR